VLVATEKESRAQLPQHIVTAAGLAVKNQLVGLTWKSVKWNRESPNTFLSKNHTITPKEPEKLLNYFSLS